MCDYDPVTIQWFFYSSAGENSFVSVEFDPAMNSIICIYSNQSLETLKYCNVTITHGPDCDEVLHTYNSTSKSRMIITPKIETVPGVSEYCYSICASRDGGKIVIEGNLNLNLIVNGKSIHA